MESEVSQKIQAATKRYQNFPKEGVEFIDIFPIVSEPEIFTLVIDIFAKQLTNIEFNKMFMLESKGFLFGPSLSLKVGKPCYPIRKKGKLPGECEALSYGLEYGQDTIEVQKELIKAGDKVVLIDDVLATGGTLNAAIDLVRKCGGEVAYVLLLSQIKKLNGIDNAHIEKEKVFNIYFD